MRVLLPPTKAPSFSHFPLLLLLLLLLPPAVWPNEPPYCHCCVFLMEKDHFTQAYQAYDIDVDDCTTSHHKCLTYCRTELLEPSNVGDLWHVTPRNQTVGQDLCHYLMHNQGISEVHNKMAYGYAMLCGGPWEYVGASAQQPLCCSKGQHVHCIL